MSAAEKEAPVSESRSNLTFCLFRFTGVTVFSCSLSSNNPDSNTSSYRRFLAEGLVSLTGRDSVFTVAGSGEVDSRERFTREISLPCAIFFSLRISCSTAYAVRPGNKRLNTSSDFRRKRVGRMLTIVQVCRNSIDVNLGIPCFDESH